MSDDRGTQSHGPADEPARIALRPISSGLLWLERLTAMVLLAVIFALVWIVVVAYEDTWLRLSGPQVEVAIILVLLAAALILVSLIALRHTRS